MLNVQLSQNDPLLATNAVKKRSSKWIFALISIFLFIAAVAYVYTNPVIETPSVHRYVEEEITDDEALEADRKGGKGGGSGKKGGKGGKTGGKGSKGSKGGSSSSEDGSSYPDACPPDMRPGQPCSFSDVCYSGASDCCGTGVVYPTFEYSCVNGVVKGTGHGCASANCPITDQCPASIQGTCSFSGVCEYGAKRCGDTGPEIAAYRCTCGFLTDNLMKCDDTTCGSYPDECPPDMRPNQACSFSGTCYSGATDCCGTGEIYPTFEYTCVNGVVKSAGHGCSSAQCGVVGKGACPSEEDYQMMGKGECYFSGYCTYGAQNCCPNGEIYPAYECRCDGGSMLCLDWNCDKAVCK